MIVVEIRLTRVFQDDQTLRILSPSKESLTGFVFIDATCKAPAMRRTARIATRKSTLRSSLEISRFHLPSVNSATWPRGAGHLPASRLKIRHVIGEHRGGHRVQIHGEQFLSSISPRHSLPGSAYRPRTRSTNASNPGARRYGADGLDHGFPRHREIRREQDAAALP
jgi:hypothetical protein